jgi:hypothetical protein
MPFSALTEQYCNQSSQGKAIGLDLSLVKS